MDISNRTLGLLLVAAIVISIGGTFISLNKLDAVSTTGFATNNETGTVSLDVSPELSITTADDATIDFGTCTLDPTQGYSEFDSNLTSGGLNNSDCTLGTFPDYIVLRNNGNVEANVTVRSNITGADLFTIASSPSNSYWQYKTISVDGTGCGGSDDQDAYATISAADTDYKACDNLGYTGGNDNIWFYAKMWVNSSVDGGSETNGAAEVTFEARSV